MLRYEADLVEQVANWSSTGMAKNVLRNSE